MNALIFSGKETKSDNADVIVQTSASGGYMENVIIQGVTDPQKYERKLLHNV